MHKRHWIGAGVLAGLLAWLIAPCWRQAPLLFGQTGPKETTAVSVERCPLAKIPPGTVLGDKVPEGWTNLLHSVSVVLTEEDVRKSPNKKTEFYARLFRYTMLARVAKGEKPHELKEVAVGFATDIKGKDTIIDSKNRLGANLGLFGGLILDGNEKELPKYVQQVVKTPTLRIIDDRQYFLHGGKHVLMVMRYGIRVDPGTGRLATLVWLVEEKDKENVLAEEAMQLLPDGFREKYNPSIDFKKVGRFSAEEDAMARRKIPQGKAVPFTPALRELAGRKTFTREQAVALDKALGEAVPALGGRP